MTPKTNLCSAIGLFLYLFDTESGITSEELTICDCVESELLVAQFQVPGTEWIHRNSWLPGEIELIRWDVVTTELFLPTSMSAPSSYALPESWLMTRGAQDSESFPSLYSGEEPQSPPLLFTCHCLSIILERHLPVLKYLLHRWGGREVLMKEQALGGKQA